MAPGHSSLRGEQPPAVLGKFRPFSCSDLCSQFCVFSKTIKSLEQHTVKLHSPANTANYRITHIKALYLTYLVLLCKIHKQVPAVRHLSE